MIGFAPNDQAIPNGGIQQGSNVVGRIAGTGGVQYMQAYHSQHVPSLLFLLRSSLLGGVELVSPLVELGGGRYFPAKWLAR